MEDLIANRGPARSKADYYTKHLSLRIQCHTVQPDDDESLKLASKQVAEEDLTEKPRSSSPDLMTADEEKLADSAAGTTLLGGSQPVSRFSTTRGTYGGSMRKRGTTKPVEDEESAPASKPNSMFPKLFSGARQPVGLSFTSCILHRLVLLMFPAGGTGPLARRNSCQSSQAKRP